jgi:hypothetical protein
VCLNVALVLTLVLGAAEPAKAQNEYYRPSNYTMVAGKMSTGNEVLYVVDMASQRLAAWQWDHSAKRLKIMRGRLLDNDFRPSR